MFSGETVESKKIIKKQNYQPYVPPTDRCGEIFSEHKDKAQSECIIVLNSN